jgi:peptide/nickel transport system substrate-binding protein
MAPALKAGQLDLITRVPATDVATLKRSTKLNVQTISTVYVFNIELDMRDKAETPATRMARPWQKSRFWTLRAPSD